MFRRDRGRRSSKFRSRVVSLPVLRGHLLEAVTCQNEVTSDEATTTTETVQQGVQAGGGEAVARERQGHHAGRERARSDGQCAAHLGGHGGGRGEDRLDAGRARRTEAAAQGQGASGAGGRDPGGSDGLLREPKAMRFAFIDGKKAKFPVSDLCRVLKVRRSGYYAWLGREESAHSKADRMLAVEVAAVFAESKKRYGSPRVHRVLRKRRRVCRHRVARLMREQRL